jgi:hypothetical protein
MADHPPGKQVAIDGVPIGTLFSTFRDDDTLVEQLRCRAEYVGLSYGAMDQITQLGEGSSGKYLAPARARNLSTASALRICEALGLKAVLVVDEELTRKMKRQWTKRDGRKIHSRRPPALGKAQLRRFLKPIAQEMGRRGAASWLARTTSEQRRELGRRGAAVRWGNRALEREAADVHPAQQP